MQTDFFKLDILSPIHIGTGDELDPLSYLMRQEDGKFTCYVLDTQSWAKDYPDPMQLSETFSGGSVPSMRGFLAKSIDPEIYGLRRIEVSNEKIFREYEQKLADQRTSHQLLFSPHITSGDRVPLIPGSSLKGSMRTAVIDWLDRKKHLGLRAVRAKDRNGQEYRKCLENALGKISENAFKQLKISDVTGYADSTQLVQPLEVRRKEGKTATPKNMCEVLPSRVIGENERATLYVKIALGSLLQTEDRRLTLRDGQSWDWHELSTVVNNYYIERFEEEKTKFYGLANFLKAKPACEKIEAELKPLPGQMVLRVGHYSQVEFVTVSDNQPFTRKGKQGTPMPYGTTRTLANGLLPFGWVRLTPCSEAEYRKGISVCESANHATLAMRQEKRDLVFRERHQQLLARQQREEDLKQQAERARQRQAELDALPQEERDFLLLDRGMLNEQQIMEFYNKIDRLDSNMQIRAATSLKKLWIAEKRWSKKECSKKQLIKVTKIKTILNEKD